jgi:putative ABC transport system permease protein
VRSLWRLQQVEPGFATRDLLTMQLEISYPNDPSRGKYLPQAPRGAYFTEILRRVREVPGVTDVALASWLPLEGEVTESSYTAEGADARTEADAKRVQVIVVSGGYFRVMGIPLRRGRDLTPQDDAEAPPVAVVSETFARQAWPGRDALGKRFKPGPSDSPSPWRTVVGIVPDVRAHRLEDDPVAQVYWSYLADTPTAIRLATRTRSDPAALAEAIRAAVQTIDRDQPVFAVRTMEQIIGAQLAPRRLATLSLGVFAALAAVLAAIGLYGLLSYTVTQRRREIAVRMALGASPGRIVASVCGDGLRLAVAGTAIGLIAAVSLGRVVASLVFGIRPGDLATLLAATCAMLMIALTACLVPARRAAAVDPYAALN